MIEALKLLSSIFYFAIFAIKVGLFRNPTRVSAQKKCIQFKKNLTFNCNKKYVCM